MIFRHVEGMRLQATSMQRTCSYSPVKCYQCFIEIALLCIDNHFPLSGIYWKLHSFDYSWDTCYLCAFAITPIIVKKTLHTFFQFDFAPAFPNLQVSSLRAQGSSPWLDLLLARPDKNVFIINLDHLGSEKINWKSFIILDQSSGNGKVEHLWIATIRNSYYWGTTANWGFQALCPMLVCLDQTHPVNCKSWPSRKTIADW